MTFLISSDYVAKYAVRKMFSGKMIIIPGFTIRLVCWYKGLSRQSSFLKIRMGYRTERISNLKEAVK